MVPKRKTIVVWGKEGDLRLPMVVEEVDSYYGYEPQLVALKMSRFQDTGEVEVDFHIKTFQRGRLQDIPLDKVGAESESTRLLNEIRGEAGLEWRTGSIPEGGVSQLRFSLHGEKLPLIEQIIQLALKLDVLIIKPEYRGKWIASGHAYQEAYVPKVGGGIEPLFDWVLQERLKKPIP